jgi:aminoglycoside phosphotransferase (APT) family kinase protein
MLRYLEDKGCDFVPRIIESHDDELYLVTSNCGQIVDKISNDRLVKLFNELETYGVRHGDQFVRNITYDDKKGRFCVIDFEFAKIIESGEGLSLEDVQKKKDA